METTEELVDIIRNLEHSEQLQEWIPVMQKMPVVEVGELLSTVDAALLPDILGMFSGNQQGYIFCEFSLEKQLSLFQLMSKRRFSKIFENMPSEYRADFFQELDQRDQVALLPFLSKRVREDVIQLSAYPPDTAGGIMSTDFATVQQDMTCAQAIEKVRSDAPSKRTVYYIYVVDNEQRMTGFITLKDLILAKPDTIVGDTLHKDYVYVYVDEDQEAVANKIDKYDLVALPVLNEEDQLVGIVTHDEAMEIIRAEQTEDMEKFMGIMPGKDELEYIDTTSWQHFRKRVAWVVSLAAVGIISGMIIHRFEGALEKLLILALYMPMVADTGGNSGSQSATVVIRALALGQVTVSNWMKILWKEAKIAILLSVCLGTLAFAKVLFLSWETEIPAMYGLSKVAFVIALAISIQVITATVIGAGLPLLVKRFGGDPAVAASPAITTIVDITGLLIYFGMATAFFDI